jgi:hypothetical protein
VKPDPSCVVHTELSGIIFLISLTFMVKITSLRASKSPTLASLRDRPVVYRCCYS